MTDSVIVAVFEIGTVPNMAEVGTTITQPDWPARDPDRVIVIHFHFAPPPCPPTTSGSRIQVKGGLQCIAFAVFTNPTRLLFQL